jgi:hypothetical protein
MHSWPNENNLLNLQKLMSTTSKKRKHLTGITVDPNMRDYSKDPYVLKKAERARELIAKYPIPEDMLRKKPK